MHRVEECSGVRFSFTKLDEVYGLSIGELCGASGSVLFIVIRSRWLYCSINYGCCSEFNGVSVFVVNNYGFVSSVGNLERLVTDGC